MRIGIVGLGAIGGSLALAWRDHASVLGWSNDSADRESARAAGITVVGGDESAWPTEMTRAAALVLAVPLNEVSRVVHELLPGLPDECLVLHVAGLQRREALGLGEADFRRILGTHPIAGSERSGFGAANAAMFRGATVRAESRATASERARIDALWRAAGAARIVWEDAEAHDALMSWVSHLSQLTATALAAVLAQQGIGARELGPGARDATRLAASDYAMWAPILDNAPRETVAAVRRLTSALQRLGDALEAHELNSVEQTWQDGRSWRTRAEDRA